MEDAEDLDDLNAEESVNEEDGVAPDDGGGSYPDYEYKLDDEPNGLEYDE